MKINISNERNPSAKQRKSDLPLWLQVEAGTDPGFDDYERHRAMEDRFLDAE